MSLEEEEVLVFRSMDSHIGDVVPVLMIVIGSRGGLQVTIVELLLLPLLGMELTRPRPGQQLQQMLPGPTSHQAKMSMILMRVLMR
jgi:hypothetical protein